MNDSELEALLDAAWKRSLTAAESAALREWGRSHPDRWPGVEAELQVARQLDAMPDVPVPSNFVSRIWQEVESVERSGERNAARGQQVVLGWRRWIPRFALAAAVAGISVAGWWRHEAAQRSEIAERLEFVAADLPDPRMLKEFEAIRTLSESNGSVDVELLTALQ